MQRVAAPEVKATDPTAPAGIPAVASVTALPCGVDVGTADAVRAYCKELIDDVAPGGGYIMSFGTAMDEGKPDTVHAMVDFTREYGVYS